MKKFLGFFPFTSFETARVMEGFLESSSGAIKEAGCVPGAVKVSPGAGMVSLGAVKVGSGTVKVGLGAVKVGLGAVKVRSGAVKVGSGLFTCCFTLPFWQCWFVACLLVTSYKKILPGILIPYY